MSSKPYRPWNPDQMVLFPSAMRDALEEGHLVFRIMDVVEALDISCITDRIQEKDPRGVFFQAQIGKIEFGHGVLDPGEEKHAAQDRQPILDPKSVFPRAFRIERGMRYPD